ncbi:MAG: PDZ domain-containing protein [Actinomycetota bacterium]
MNEDGPEAAPHPRSGAIITIAAVIVFGLVIAGFLVRADYSSLSPGPTTNMLDEITAKGVRTYPSHGKLLLTTVSVEDGPLSLIEIMRIWAGRNELIPPGAIRPPCTTDQQNEAQNVADIEGSKLEAQLAAYQFLGFPAKRLKAERILGVVDGTPAKGKLKPGDVFAAVDGHPTPDQAAVVRWLRAKPSGSAVHVTVVRDGKRVSYTVRTEPSGPAMPGCEPPHPVIGITLGPDYRFPSSLTIDTGDVGGPSGGLVFTLAIIDKLTPGDLTQGHTIAATGQIAVDDKGVAHVLPIGGIREKVASVVASGCDVFVVPKEDLKDALAVAPRSLTVIGVSTLREAIAALARLPARR